ncbi:hypothetical protein PIB30_088758, partial [Stylosanthes scabra]|nr:hypothetical protein [Stylosanthes scabra]
SLLEVVGLDIGYSKNGIAAMWFKATTESTEDGLKMLRTGKDAMELAKIGVRDESVELYVVHKSDFYRNSCTIEEIEVEEVVGPCEGGVGAVGLEAGPIGKAQHMSLAEGGQEAKKQLQ